MRKHTLGSRTGVPMVETDECGDVCGHVADLIVMAQAFAELRDGVVARALHEHGFKCGHNFAQTLYAGLPVGIHR